MSKHISKIASLVLVLSLCFSAFIFPVRAESIGSNNATVVAVSHEGFRQTVQIASAVATFTLIGAFIAGLRWLIKVGTDEKRQKTALKLTLLLGIVIAIAGTSLLIATFFWDTIGPFGTASHSKLPWVVIAPAMLYRGMRCRVSEPAGEDIDHYHSSRLDFRPAFLLLPTLRLEQISGLTPAVHIPGRTCHVHGENPPRRRRKSASSPERVASAKERPHTVRSTQRMCDFNTGGPGNDGLPKDPHAAQQGMQPA